MNPIYVPSRISLIYQLDKYIFGSNSQIGFSSWLDWGLTEKTLGKVVYVLAEVRKLSFYRTNAGVLCTVGHSVLQNPNGKQQPFHHTGGKK